MQPSQISYQAGISDLCFWSTLTVALNGVSAVWSVIPQANLPGGTQWKHPTISWLISIAGSLEAHLSFPRPQILLPSIQQQEKVIVYEWWRQPPIGLSASCLAISSSSLLLLWWLLPLLCHLPVATLLILSAFPSHILPPQALHFKPEWAPATDALPLPLSPHSPEPQIFLSVLSFYPSPSPSQEARAALPWARARSHLSATLGTALGFSSCRLTKCLTGPGNMSRSFFSAVCPGARNGEGPLYF